MASTERSLGWATGVAATDGATTYDSTRMSAMERAGLGVGILLNGSYLSMSGTGLTTLTIADGNAIVGGYFYESNGSVTMATATLGSITYTVVVIANTTGGSLTVAANGAGTTLVTTATTRAALVTAAQLATITAAVTATNLLVLGTVATTAGTITTITPYFPFATARQLSDLNYATMTGGTVTLTAANTDYTVASYTVATPSYDGTIAVNGITGIVTLLASGYYLFSVQVQFSTGTTGVRKLSITSLLNNYAISPTNFGTASWEYLTYSAYIGVTPGLSTPIAITAASTVVGQSVLTASISVKRV